jgi:hypothetical protein
MVLRADASRPCSARMLETDVVDAALGLCDEALAAEVVLHAGSCPSCAERFREIQVAQSAALNFVRDRGAPGAEHCLQPSRVAPERAAVGGDDDEAQRASSSGRRAMDRGGPDHGARGLEPRQRSGR